MRKVRGVHEKKQIKISVICVEKETCGENSLEEYENKNFVSFSEKIISKMLQKYSKNTLKIQIYPRRDLKIIIFFKILNP